MAWNIMRIFKHKITNSLQGLITTQDKLLDIKATYEENSEKYMKSAVTLLTNAKIMKDKLHELESQEADSKKTYESLIRKNDLDNAKMEYIKYKGYASARDAVAKSYDTIKSECEKAEENLKHIKTNKLLIDTKLSVLATQIEACHTMNLATDAIGDFGFDCNAMLEEVENEVKATRYKMDSKREVNELVNGQTNIPVSVKIDDEFEAVVNSVKNGQN